ncbi:MAP7 domain-containing protein [Polaribacter gangjinensis]|uniref:Tetratricopeptide repeat protein n=1 Tax=Polaribacter gangjinensis TaxID=574710 RepID=A0A2S7WEB8_9FLAO|nr:hypothetical protein [Polaribacter gangjinensis]PQJ75944.1 hypothetical protein BTO13_12235 [Polaribacter gangjinensis]
MKLIKHILLILFLLPASIQSIFAQKGVEKSTTVSFGNRANNNQNGFDFSGVKFGYQFVNCGGNVVMGVNYSKNANFTTYWYNGKSYNKQAIGAELWPKPNEVEINTVKADLYFKNQNLGSVKLNYIVGNFAGCFGETHDVLKQVGKNSTSKEYKDNINDLSLQNIQVIAARAIGLWREPKINDKLNLLQKQKEEEKINAKVFQLEKDANLQIALGNFKNAKLKFEEAYKLQPSDKLKAEIEKANNLLLKKDKEDKIQAKLNEAYNLLNSNNFELALSKFKEVYAVHPTETIKQQIEYITKKIEEKKNNTTSDTTIKNNSNISNNTTYSKKSNPKRTTTNTTTNSKRTYNTKLTNTQNAAIDYAISNYELNLQRKLREQDRLYEQRRKEQLEEERKWQAEQRKERKRIREAAIQEANYQKYIKEQKERERIAKIEEEKRFNNWLRNEKARLDNQLTNWNNNVLAFINKVDKTYSIGKAENNIEYFDKLIQTLDNIIIAPNIPVLDKSIFIDDIINKTKGYQNIYSKYNYRNFIPEEIKNNLEKVYLYAKSHYGYHPATQYQQIFTHNKSKNKSDRINDILIRKTSIAKKAFKDGDIKVALFEYISAIINSNDFLESYNKPNLENFRHHINFGYILYYNGNLDYAKAYLKKGLEYYEKNKIYSPEYFEAYSHLISAYTKKDYPKEFIVDIENFEKRLKKSFNINKLDKINIKSNNISVDKNLQQSYFRVLAHGYQSLEGWNSMVKTKHKISHNSILNEAKSMIKKTDNIYELGNVIGDLVGYLKYREENFYKKYLTEFSEKRILPNYKKNEDLITLIRNSYNNKDYELTEKLGKEFILNNSISPSNYPDEINLAIRSAIFNGNFETGLTFAHYSLYRKKYQTRESSIRDTSDEKYALLLINLIMLNKTGHFYLIFDQDNKEIEKGTQITFYIQKDLAAFASSQKDGVYGYEILENIVKKFSEKKNNSPAILYIYNAINDAKTKI